MPRIFVRNTQSQKKIFLFELGAGYLQQLIFVVILLRRSPRFRRDSHTVYKGALNCLRKIVCHLCFTIVLVCAVPKARFGFSAIALMVLCGAALLINVVASHLKKYTAVQRKYRDLLQIASLAGVAIFVCFSVFLEASGVVCKATIIFPLRSAPTL